MELQKGKGHHQGLFPNVPSDFPAVPLRPSEKITYEEDDEDDEAYEAESKSAVGQAVRI